MHDAVRKGAIKDQEIAGVDIISDGELQRDNMIDYFAERLPGVQIDLGSKRFYYDYYDSVVRSKLATGSLGLVEEARFLRRFTDRRTKVTISGPHTLVKRIQNQHYPSEEAFALDLARVLNLELRELGTSRRDGSADRRAVLFGLSRGSAVGDPRRQRDGRWRRGASDAAHLLRQPVRKAVLGRQLPVPLPDDRRGKGPGGLARVRAARRRGPAAVRAVQGALHASASASSTSRRTTSSRPAVVADRIRRALKILPAERLTINPDCGLVHLPREVAFMKLCAMVEGTRLVREELAR